METIEILKAARARISKPENWIQGAAFDPHAGGCWCSVGALFASGPPDSASDAWAALVGTLEGESVVAFNDDPDRNHAEVLDLFDRTIARLEAETAQ